MQYALVAGERVEARETGQRAACPSCQTPVIAKCGEIIIHHWAHESARDCDLWHSEEGEWHRAWKKRFPEEWREVVLGPHRADIQRPDGVVIEFQSKGLSTSDFCKREAFYGQMIWVVDARKPFEAGRIRIARDRASFTWSHKWKSLHACKSPVFLDIGPNGLLWVTEFPPEEEFGAFVWDPELGEAVWDDDEIGPGRTFGCEMVPLRSFLEYGRS